MSIFIIPVDADPIFKQRVTLDGEDYIFRIRYSQREDRYWMDLSDANEDPISMGIKLVINCDFLRTIVDERKPPGRLYCFDYPGSDSPIKASAVNSCSFGSRIQLTYLDLAEITEAA